jgi:hypothetical protein
MRILCLHGYGTSPDVMKYQMSPLIKQCDPSWEFYYLPGNLECPLDPGELIVHTISVTFCVVLILMVGIAPAVPGPYLCYSADLDPTSMRGAHALVKETFDNEGPFDGVFGFSQGAAVLLAYLLEQITIYPEKPLPVRFGIFCSSIPILATDPAYYQPILSILSPEDQQRLRSARDDQLDQLKGPARVAIKSLVGAIDALEPVTRRSRSSFLDRQPLEIPCVLHPALYKARLPIPTLHVRGRNEPSALKERSVLSESFCLPRWRRTFEHSAIHDIPRSMADIKGMVSSMEWVIARSQLSKL